MKKKILIADDNAALQKQVEIYLRKQGYEVLVAVDGWECIAQLNKHNPDIILLDIEMPKMGGLYTLEVMATYNITQRCPVIMLTGESHKEIVVRSLQLGAVDYLVKPFGLKDLMERITKHLSSNNKNRSIA